MLGEFEFESEKLARTTEVAQRLRRLAEQMEQGTVIIDEEEISIPDKIELKIEFEEQYDDDLAEPIGFELEVELLWPIQLYWED